MVTDRYEALRRRLANTDPVELAAGLAALQLIPENADSLPVIESAAEFVATLRRWAGRAQQWSTRADFRH